MKLNELQRTLNYIPYSNIPLSLLDTVSWSVIIDYRRKRTSKERDFPPIVYESI